MFPKDNIEYFLIKFKIEGLGVLLMNPWGNFYILSQFLTIPIQTQKLLLPWLTEVCMFSLNARNESIPQDHNSSLVQQLSVGREKNRWVTTIGQNPPGPRWLCLVESQIKYSSQGTAGPSLANLKAATSARSPVIQHTICLLKRGRTIRTDC